MPLENNRFVPDEPIKKESIRKTPYSRNFLSEILRGPELPKKESSLEPKKSNIFNRRKEGAKRGELRQELAKMYDPKIPFDKNERIALEKELSEKKFSEYISEEDIKKHLKALDKDMKKANYPKDKKPFADRIKIWEKLRDRPL